MAAGTPLRIHICPVSYEIDRVVLPLLKLKADEAILVTKRTSPEKDKAKKYIERIQSMLKVHDIPFKMLQCDLDDFHDCLLVVSSAIKKERDQGNLVFVNISTGGRVLSHAASIAGMMHEASLYYAVPESDEREEREVTHGVSRILPMPSFRIEPPEEELLDCLDVLKKAGGSLRKREFIEHLRERGLVSTRSTKSQAIYGVAKRLCRPLIERGWVEEEGRTRAMVVRLSSEGERVLRGARGP